MIVDDNPANLKLAGDLLELEGHDVIRCIDAEHAREVLIQQQPILILMDVALPGMDGLELTRILKSDPTTKDIIIVALTAYAMKNDKDKVLDAGCDGYITKPIDTRQFIQQVGEYLKPITKKTQAFNILLVDDNPTSLKLIKAVYETEGYHTMTASNGLEALNILSSQHADLIVTDVLMPEMDGYYKLRSNELLKDIPIIVYTATYTSLSDEAVAKEMGADLFIRKPAPTKLLISSAKEILANTSRIERPTVFPPTSVEVMHQYSSELINKLEKRNLELEEIKDNLEVTLKRFAQAQQIAHLGHWELNLRTEKVIWSEETSRILGIEPYTIEPSFDTFLKYIHPEDREKIQSIIEHSIQSLSSYSITHRLLLANGNLRHVFVRGEFEFDKVNKPLRFYGTIMDVTELRQKEENLKLLNEELELFIYRSSHDLKGPITTLSGLVYLAQMELPNHNVNEFIQHIDTVTHKLKTTISQLLQIMHLRKREPCFEPVEMNALILEIIDSFKYMDEHKNIQFNIQMQPVQAIITDKELISSSLSNLIDNAIRYRQSESSFININIQNDENQKRTIIEIEDNGIGIPEKCKDKIFDMFYRATEKSQGAGLGLYLVKNAVTKINGTIAFNSEQGKGSNFRITLPV